MREVNDWRIRAFEKVEQIRRLRRCLTLITAEEENIGKILKI
jgi:hypothetical protein